MGRFKLRLHHLWTEILARDHLEVLKLRRLSIIVVALSAALASLSVRGLANEHVTGRSASPYGAGNLPPKIEFWNKMRTLGNQLSKSDAREGGKRI
jgi:hypothetical protein